MKIDLVREKEMRGFRPKGLEVLRLVKSLPFYHRMGNYVHRVRSGWIYVESGEWTHTSIRFWCGGTGFLAPRRKSRYADGNLIAQVPSDAVCCATCEGRVIGAGVTESRVLAGRFLSFSPRVWRG
jgi:hypothetical protein